MSAAGSALESAGGAKNPAAGEGPVRTPPALGPGVWRVLFANEWFKLRKRTAFWLTLGFFAFIATMANGEEFYRARNDPERTFALPGAWAEVIGEMGVVLLIFASVAVILLVTSEFSWRTARQNVIDGLSKTQWFWGKVLLLPVLGLVFVVTLVGIGGGFALAGTDLAAAGGPLVPFSVFQTLGAILLGFFVVGGLALFISLAVRSSGGAMAIWFFWIAVGEQQIVAGLLGRFFESLRPLLGYLPWTNVQRAIAFRNYDAPTFQRMVEAAQEAGRTVPTRPDIGTITLVNLGWIALFVGVAFFWFRKRDL